RALRAVPAVACSEAELVRVEGERLVLVVDPDLHVRELVQHGVPPCESMTPTTLVTRPCSRLLESCCSPAGPTPGSGTWGSARARPQADTHRGTRPARDRTRGRSSSRNAPTCAPRRRRRTR